MKGSEILSRIASIKETIKTTDAMQKISISRMKKMETKLKPSRIFFDTLTQTIKNIDIDENFNNKFFNSNSSSKTAFIVVGSDKELCGNYNSAILEKTYEEIKNKDVLIYPIGIIIQKALAKNDDLEKNIEYTSLNYDVNFDLVKILSNELIDLFLQEKINSIKIIYTISKNKNYIAHIENILPIDKNELLTKKQSYGIIYEPNKEQILNSLFHIYIDSKIYNCLVESVYIEHYRRMTTMKQSTDNANQILENLKNQYNKKRQESITLELLDSYANKFKR